MLLYPTVAGVDQFPPCHDLGFVADVFKDPRKLEYLNSEGAYWPLRSPIPHSTLVAARTIASAAWCSSWWRTTARRSCSTTRQHPLRPGRPNMALWMAHNPYELRADRSPTARPSTSVRGSEHLVRVWRDRRGAARRRTPVLHGRAGARGSETAPGLGRRDRRALRARAVRARGSRWTTATRPGPQALQALDVHIARGPRADRKGADAQVRGRARADALDRPVCEARHRSGCTTLRGARHAPSTRSGPSCTTRTSARRRVDRDAPADLRAPHQPVVPGGVAPCHRGGRPAGLRHRHDRPVRLLRRPVALVDGRPRAADAAQRDLYLHAREQIQHNLDLIQPGMDYREYMQRSWPIPDRYLANRYRVAARRGSL